MHRQATFASVRAHVDKQISTWRCTTQEVAARQIGWVDDLDTAFALARASGRPVFIIAGDGDVCTGRL
jgi:hypothetical protein